MDPLLVTVANLGGGFAIAVIILILHRDALKSFRDEMAAERERNDRNLERFFDKLDKVAAAAICRVPMFPPPK